MDSTGTDIKSVSGSREDGAPDRGTGVLVVLLNDDYTPMEFVIDVLQIFFGMNIEKATQIMLAVHTTGRATCAIFTRDIAETKSAQINQYAQDNDHPLVSIIEAAD